MALLFETLHKWRESTSLDIGAIGAKIRLGMTQREQDFKVYLPVAEAAAGRLDYLAVHARHGEQRSRELPTWAAIGEIKQLVGASLPIIGNGDVRSRCDAQEMQRRTGCDGVMVARGAMDNPWSLRQLTGVYPLDEALDATHALPSVAQLDAAWHAWDRATRELPGRPRFERFHLENFKRLRRECLQAQAGRGDFAPDGRVNQDGVSPERSAHLARPPRMRPRVRVRVRRRAAAGWRLEEVT